MFLKAEPSIPSPKRCHLGHTLNASSSPIRMSFIWWILMKKNERLMSSLSVALLKETDMNRGSTSEGTFDPTRFWMETCHVLDFFVSITRDFSSQMGREHLRLHVHFLKVNNVWQKILLLTHYFWRGENVHWQKTKTCIIMHYTLLFMLIIAVLILLRKILILFPDAANWSWLLQSRADFSSSLFCFEPLSSTISPEILKV